MICAILRSPLLPLSILLGIAIYVYWVKRPIKRGTLVYDKHLKRYGILVDYKWYFDGDIDSYILMDSLGKWEVCTRHVRKVRNKEEKLIALY